MLRRQTFHVWMFAIKGVSLCFHRGDYRTNEANLMSMILIHSDNWGAQKWHISYDIWLKGKLQSMFFLALFDSEGISCVKVTLCCLEPLCSANQFAIIWSFS